MINVEEARVSAAISFMSALLENTTHNVLEEPAIAKIYSVAAVNYADALIEELGLKNEGNNVA